MSTANSSHADVSLSSGASSLARLLEASGGIRFGTFTTKSGRPSPYLIDFGRLDSGERLLQLGDIYAYAICRTFPECNVVHGLPYKGIPLAAVTAVALTRTILQPVYLSFFRKVGKEHGEQGKLVGRQSVSGDRVVLVDDVITSGVYLIEAIRALRECQGVEVVGALVGVDRCERGMDSPLLARDLVLSETGVPVHSVLTIRELVARLGPEASKERREVEAHLAMYGDAA